MMWQTLKALLSKFVIDGLQMEKVGLSCSCRLYLPAAITAKLRH